MSELNYSKDAMKLMMELRRLLLRDHGKDVHLDQEAAAERLFDAAREVRDRKADALAHRIAGHLTETNAQRDVDNLVARLEQNYRDSMAHVAKRVTKRIYRGCVVPSS